MARGTLRVYLGAAPGVGKTFAMLDEGRRRHERGTDVVVGFVETHGRAETAAQLARPRGDAPAADRPTGARSSRRWTSTPCSRAGAARGPGRRAGPHQRARLPPREALAGRRGAPRRRHRRDLHRQRAAPRVAQRRGGAHHRRRPARDRARRGGARGRPDRAGRHEPRGAAPAHGPRQHLPARARSTPPSATTSGPGNLTALRELALLWVADQVDDGAAGLHGAPTASPSRGRRASGWWWPSPARPAASSSIRRAARMAQRAQRRAARRPRAWPPTGSPPRRSRPLAQHRQLLDDLGGTYHEVVGDDVARRPGRLRPGRERHPARARRQPRGRGGAELRRGSVINKVMRELRGIDVHVISTPTPTRADGRAAPRRRSRRASPLLGPAARPVGWALAVVGAARC